MNTQILSDEQIAELMTPDVVEGDRYLPYSFARVIESAVLAELRNQREGLQATKAHQAPCAGSCEANAFYIEIRRLRAEVKKQATDFNEIREILMREHSNSPPAKLEVWNEAIERAAVVAVEVMTDGLSDDSVIYAIRQLRWESEC